MKAVRRIFAQNTAKILLGTPQGPPPPRARHVALDTTGAPYGVSHRQPFFGCRPAAFVARMSIF